MKTHLVFGLLTLLLLVVVISSRQQETFDFQNVVSMAREMATEGYLSTSPALSKELRDLNYDQLRDIRWKNEYTLWRREGSPFQVRFFHPGSHEDRSVEIYTLPDSPSVPLRYSPDFFDFGKNVLKERPPESTGYAGFRVHYPLNKPDVLDEVLAFKGASYFRVPPKGLIYGLSARGLALDSGIDNRPEEFPVFTKFWLKRPEGFGHTMTIYALLESKTVMGAYQFELELGDETIMHVKAVLFFRRKAENAGYAPLTSMFWFGENTSNTFGDFRPEVHDSDGLLMQRQNGEWVWHPLAWAGQKQLNVFEDARPKGFGLLQRDRDFNHYQDLEALYNKRPSLWVQPLKGFDKGAVKLIQLHAKNEFEDNVVAFWNPAEPPPLRQAIELEYVLRWYGDTNDLPPIGRCVSTRVDDQDKPYYRHFILEFAGGQLNKIKATDLTEANIDATSITGAGITEKKVEWNDFNKTWRVSFFAGLPENQKPNEVICRLLFNGQPVTETWSYTVMPQ